MPESQFECYVRSLTPLYLIYLLDVQIEMGYMLSVLGACPAQCSVDLQRC